MNEYIDNICGSDAPSIILLPLPYIGNKYDKNFTSLISNFDTIYMQYFNEIKRINQGDNWYLQLPYVTKDKTKSANIFFIRVLDQTATYDYLQLSKERFVDYFNFLFNDTITVYLPIPFWKDICHIEHFEMFLIEHDFNVKLIHKKSIN